jgi:drug/metabolite transporter (DMT)-like permease
MLMAAACFVANVLLIRALGNGAADAWTTTAVRFAAGLAICLGLHRRALDTRALATRPRLILRGLLGGLGTFGLYVTIIALGAGRAVFLNNLYVILGALLAVPMLGERFRTPLALGALAAVAGVALLTDAFAGGFALGRYEVLALGVALISAWIIVTIRQLHHEGINTPTIFAAQCVYGLLFCAPMVIRHPPQLHLITALGLVAAGLCAGFGQLAMTRAYRELPVGEGALLQTLVPLGCALGGVLFFQESLEAPALLGGLLIVGGSLLPLWPARPR